MSAAVLFPSFETRSMRLSYWAVVFLRSLFFALFVTSLDRVVVLGTAPSLVTAGSIIGILVASRLAFTPLTQRGFFSLALISGVLYRLLLIPLNALSQIPSFRAFLGFDVSLHLNLIAGAIALAAVLTWCFWKFRHALTLEILALSGVAVYFFSGHRNFHFDTPRIIQQVAWALKIEQLSALIVLGTCMTVGLLAYIYFATLPSKPVAHSHASPVRANLSRPSLVFGSLLMLLMAGLIYIITSALYSFYSQEAATRAANGVGEAANEGMSPLGFHSALGSTNQPAALVRLEGDYKENPFLPMLYMRESALSSFNGRELTIANRAFDQDVSLTAPGEAFRADEDVELMSRTPLVQSVYLLTDHKLAFALDYPLSILGLKNPNPSRFKAAYRAYSMAPGFPLMSLAELDVGDPRWTPAMKAHYLEPHPDHRYADLAREITADVQRPVEKAAAVVQYLSKNAIYTLTPNHEVKPDEDPVAPFLFGDKRGYCVHFAHATVYMLRALGIPSRIGTGYLTDLSQAKDGHILLRMSDRHAWAEVYVAGHGWIPFDTQPEQVENHADTQVDSKVLEELMGLLGPGEEILPKDLGEHEPALQEPPAMQIPGGRLAGAVGLAFLLTIAIVKLYLRYGWILPGGAPFKLRRSYIALLSYLYDLGFRREYAETRLEYRHRIERSLGVSTLSLGDVYSKLLYASSDSALLDRAEVDASRGNDFDNLRSVNRWRRFFAALSPSSTFAALMGSRW